MPRPPIAARAVAVWPPARNSDGAVGAVGGCAKRAAQWGDPSVARNTLHTVFGGVDCRRTHVAPIARPRVAALARAPSELIALHLHSVAGAIGEVAAKVAVRVCVSVGVTRGAVRRRIVPLGAHIAAITKPLVAARALTIRIDARYVVSVGAAVSLYHARRAALWI